MSLFQPLRLSERLTVRNRIMRSALWEGGAGPNGEVTKRLVEQYCELARNNVGLLCLSHTFVSADGKAHPGQLGIHTDAATPGFTELASAVHSASAGSVVCVQITHAGRLAKGDEVQVALGPSNVAVEEHFRECREATEEDIARVTRDFAAAARRAQQAGFDCVELHLAHGYLLSEFLSPLFNKRTDRYGGSLENRMRLPLEIIAAIHSECGSDFPVLAKLNVEDYNPAGLSLAESTQVAVALADAGVVMIEASGGTDWGCSTAHPVRRGPESKEAYHSYGAEAWKRALGSRPCRVALVGGVRSAKNSQQLIDAGVCDVVSMARPFMREPDLVLKWQADPERARAACISCCLCCKDFENGVHCPVREAVEKKKRAQSAQAQHQQNVNA
eukprot:m51a1_g8312 putative nadh:flavin oxidoreductase (388) ;mRNA; r:86024-87546